MVKKDKKFVPRNQRINSFDIEGRATTLIMKNAEKQTSAEGGSEHGIKDCCKEQESSEEELSQSLGKSDNKKTEEKDYLVYNSGGWD